MLENHLQSKWNIPFIDTAHPRAGKTPDFSGAAIGADVSIYWGLSDGGENKTAWDNVARIGNIFRKDTTANSIELRGYDSFREENYFDLARQDKGYLTCCDGVSVLPMARVIVVSILIMIPTLSMRVLVLPMGIISPIWVSDTSLPRKRVLIPLAILIPMIGHLCVSIWIRMVILNGTEIRGRKFSVPETGEPGRFQPFRQIIITPRMKERLPSVPETISLWSCTLNMVEARVLSSVLVPQV